MTSVLARDSASPQRRDCADTCDPPPPTLTLGQTLHECTRLSPDVRARRYPRQTEGWREGERKQIQLPDSKPTLHSFGARNAALCLGYLITLLVALLRGA